MALEHQIRSNIHPKQTVRIAIKKDGVYQTDLIEGKVKEILTKSSEHYRGIKVMLEDGTVGRVQEIVHGRRK